MDSPRLEPVIVYQTERWMAVDKPAGLLSVPGKGPENQYCAAAWVRERFPMATGPVTVHRLDMDTSGLLLVALDEEMQRELSMLFERRGVSKRYTAVVEGQVSGAGGVIDVPMRADITNRPYQVVDHELGKPATTEYRVMAYEPGATRLQLTPLTGRTHQLRVHCAHLGHPILGDVLYGDEGSAPRLMLHASWLAFTDPDTGRGVEIECAPPF